MPDKHLLRSMTRSINAMLNEDGVSAEQAVFGRSPRDITHPSLGNPIDVRFTRNIPETEIFRSAARIWAMTLEITHEKMAESQPRRSLCSQNA